MSLEKILENYEICKCLKIIPITSMKNSSRYEIHCRMIKLSSGQLGFFTLRSVTTQFKIYSQQHLNSFDIIIILRKSILLYRNDETAFNAASSKSSAVSISIPLESKIRLASVTLVPEKKLYQQCY